MGPASGEGSGTRFRIRPNIWAKMVLFVSLLVLTTTGGMALVVWTSARGALNGQIMQELNNTSILKQVQVRAVQNSPATWMHANWRASIEH